MAYRERERAAEGLQNGTFYRDALRASADFRENYRKRRGVVKAEEMVWEDSPQGRIKHMVNEQMNTRENCLDIYQQSVLPGSRSGKHRHLSEEILYVLEGKGYDLHWDVNFDCQDAFIWDWEKEPKKFEWEEGDFVYIPPYSIHQHFNADASNPARFISMTSRIVKAMGFDWFEQLENAPEFPVGEGS